ncbi:unnamed protein product [Ambrosiozyma monospora]|uniref:Unnamed protein product n=1 Tax=Ambrosiozyma monospora TaxID=43982 RepID=A0ACB5SXM2_AMBMO|nr:unnamed protein product [Ambrosiozyma monospora]
MKVKVFNGIKKRTTTKLKRSTTSKKDTRHIIITTTDNVSALFERDEDDYLSPTIPSPKPANTTSPTSTLFPPPPAPQPQGDSQSLTSAHTPTSSKFHLTFPAPPANSSPTTSHHSHRHHFRRSHKHNHSNGSSIPSSAGGLNDEEVTLVTNRSNYAPSSVITTGANANANANASAALSSSSMPPPVPTDQQQPDSPGRGGRKIIRSKTSRNVVFSKDLTPFDKDEMKKKLKSQPLEETAELSWWEENGSMVIMYAGGGVVGIGLLALIVKLVWLIVKGLVLFSS